MSLQGMNKRFIVPLRRLWRARSVVSLVLVIQGRFFRLPICHVRALQ